MNSRTTKPKKETLFHLQLSRMEYPNKTPNVFNYLHLMNLVLETHEVLRTGSNGLRVNRNDFSSAPPYLISL